MKNISVTKTLPEWAEYVEADGFVEVDPAVVYPMALALLDMPEDQYSLEVARRCITTALLDMIGLPLNLRIRRDEDWQLDKFKPGAGGDRGVLEFRRHYERIKSELLKA